MRAEKDQKRNDGEAAVVGRCRRCGGEIYAGERVYRLEDGWLCPECLPEAARCWMAGRLEVAGEEEGADA